MYILRKWQLFIFNIVIVNVTGLELFVGAIFDNTENAEITKNIVDFGILMANSKILNGTGHTLSLHSSSVRLSEAKIGSEIDVSIFICKMMDTGVNIIIGPESEAISLHASNICDVKEIPYIETNWIEQPSSSTIHIYPTHKSLCNMLIDIINSKKWSGFTILYESPSWILRSSELLDFYGSRDIAITVRQLKPEPGSNNYRNVLKRVKKSEENNIILECSTKILDDVMNQMLQVGLLNQHTHLVITSLDLHTIDLDPFQHIEANITGFRITNGRSQYMDGLRPYMNAYTKPMPGQERINFTPDSVLLHDAAIFDGILIYAEAVKRLDPELLKSEVISCTDDSIFKNGFSISNYIKLTNASGLSGEVHFDQEGLRSVFDIEIYELVTYGRVPVANYNAKRGLVYTRTIQTTYKDEDETIRNAHLRIISSLNPPYCMFRDSSTQLYGNERYEGFAVDLIDELSRDLGFSFEILIQEDGNYGTTIDNVTWNGMIGKILDKQAEIAITDLTITSDRFTALDFASFMNLGIAILYRKPIKLPPSTFSFMDPFSSGVWICLGLAYIAVSTCYFFLGRISPFEWDNPYPCIEEPTELENQFTVTNSMWFAIGALLQQGSEMAPRSPSTRLVSSVWWFFTLIMVSSYTANLAAFLVTENRNWEIRNINDLAACINDTEKKITFGAKIDGSTYNFFKTHTNEKYSQIGDYMERHRDNMPKSNDEGLKKALSKDIKFAFLTESSSLQYIIERYCNVTQIGELLDDKNYGIGTRKDFKYKNDLSLALVKLQERGTLTLLYERWWKQKKGGGACSQKDKDTAIPLGLENVVGIFYTLIIGCAIATFFAILDFLLEVRKQCKVHKKQGAQDAQELGMENMQGVFFILLIGSFLAAVYGVVELVMITRHQSKKYKLSFKEELWNETMFLLKPQGNTKPVRRRSTPSSSQTQSQRAYGSYRSNGSAIHSNRSEFSHHHYK